MMHQVDASKSLGTISTSLSWLDSSSQRSRTSCNLVCCNPLEEISFHKFNSTHRMSLVTFLDLLGIGSWWDRRLDDFAKGLSVYPLLVVQVLGFHQSSSAL